MAGELSALAGELVDIRAMDVFVSVTGKLGIQVIDADEQDVGFCSSDLQTAQEGDDERCDFHED